ncbi:MAG: sugar transferase [Prolixibacteraceae bacterium]
MIKEREHVIARVSAVLQTGVSVFAFITALWLSHCYQHDFSFKDSKDCLFFSVLIIPLWMLLIQYHKLDRMCRDQGYRYLLFRYLRLAVTGTAILFLASLALGAEQIDIKVLAIFAVLDFLALFSFKTLSFRIMKFFRRRGYNFRQILLLADELSIDFIDRMAGTKDWGYRIWGIISSSEMIKERYKNQIRVVAPDQKIESILDNVTIDEVFYCKGNLDHGEIARLIQVCSEVGVVFRLKPGHPASSCAKSGITFLGDVPLYVYRNTPEDYLAMKFKSLLDYVFSFLVLILASPLLLVIAILIKIDDGGPVFFAQERIGLNGRRFNCMKFRTMVVNAEALRDQLITQNEQTGPIFKMRMDPRITRIGKILRKTSLDELPQFFNVLNGDMSVVGPRPPIPSEVKQYKRWQNRRLSMKPGITCIWQVSGRNEISFDQWMEMDMEYIDNWSLKLDLIIVLKTIKVMFEGNGQ